MNCRDNILWRPWYSFVLCLDGVSGSALIDVRVAAISLFICIIDACREV